MRGQFLWASRKTERASHKKLQEFYKKYGCPCGKSAAWHERQRRMA